MEWTPITERTWIGLRSRRGHGVDCGVDCDHGEDMTTGAMEPARANKTPTELRQKGREQKP